MTMPKIININPDGIIKRALSAIGQKCVYKLGFGGRDPSAIVPWNTEKQLDCSGFVCWANGLDRFQDPDWLSTDGIIRFAKQNKLFKIVSTPEPGDVVVYGDSKNSVGNRVQGHTGIVSVVGSWGNWSALKVIHCSNGSFEKTGDAIRETEGKLFSTKPWYFVRRI